MDGNIDGSSILLCPENKSNSDSPIISNMSEVSTLYYLTLFLAGRQHLMVEVVEFLVILWVSTK